MARAYKDPTADAAIGRVCYEERKRREREIEQQFVRAVASRGGMAAKMVCPGLDGMPDRIVLMPDARAAFVELKAPGKKPRPLQLVRHDMLRRMGFKVYVMDDVNMIGGVLDEISAS